MSETNLFQGLITDIGIKNVRDAVTTEGWYIKPYKFALSETKGAFLQSRTDMKATWYKQEFSSVRELSSETSSSSRLQLTINLRGDEATVVRDINEIYVICKTPDDKEFLYAIIQPKETKRFEPNVSLEMDFILTLTNVQNQDIYSIEYVDRGSLSAYQLYNEKGAANGYCPLGANGLVADEYLPLRDNLPIGSLVPVFCTSNYIPTGYLPCDGQEYSYDQFPSVYQDYLLADLLPNCSYVEYQNSLTTYGSCGKFGLDTTNRKFKVPYIKDGTSLQQALSNSEISKLYNAGLPNITGTITNNAVYGNSMSYTNGCITVSGQTLGEGGAGTVDRPNVRYTNTTINASRSNSIYGNSETVQPNAISLRWFILVTHGLLNASITNWAIWINQLNTNTSNISSIQTQQNLIAPYTAIGVPVFSLSNTLPNGYIRLEGATVSRTTYASLFDIYGTTYGEGDGSTTFELPNFNNRTIWGGGGSYGYIEAGLPNHYHFTVKSQYIGNATFSNLNTTWPTGWGSGSGGIYEAYNLLSAGAEADVSRSSNAKGNDIYSNSETVQPPAIKVRVITRYM